MSHTTIEEELQNEGYVLSLSVGVSMRPMLTQRTEQLLIEKLKADPKENDVVLFRRRNGQYVLHRIVRSHKEFYLIRGDNCYGSEKVYPDQIIGILNGFYRGEKYIDCSSNKRYLCYVAIWRLIYPVRLAIYKLRHYVRAVIHRVRR